MNRLSAQKCVPCEGGVPALSREEAAQLLVEVPGWELDTEVKKLSRQIIFKNFKEALACIVEVGETAEHEGHHPDLHLTRYKHVAIELSTHAIGGLSKNDFILAAKINDLYDART